MLKAFSKAFRLPQTSYFGWNLNERCDFFSTSPFTTSFCAYVYVLLCHVMTFPTLKHMLTHKPAYIREN